MIWVIIFIAISFLMGLVILIAVDRPGRYPSGQDDVTDPVPDLPPRPASQGGYVIPRRLVREPSPPPPTVNDSAIQISRTDNTVTVSDGPHTRTFLCASVGAAKGLAAHLECDRVLAAKWLRDVDPVQFNMS